MILIAYDGTDSAKHAIAVAGALLGGRRAHVLHVWQPLASPVDSLALAAVMPTAELLAGEEVRAQAIAEEGAERARAAGFDADGESVESTDSAAEVIEARDRPPAARSRRGRQPWPDRPQMRCSRAASRTTCAPTRTLRCSWFR